MNRHKVKLQYISVEKIKYFFLWDSVYINVLNFDLFEQTNLVCSIFSQCQSCAKSTEIPVYKLTLNLKLHLGLKGVKSYIKIYE